MDDCAGLAEKTALLVLGGSGRQDLGGLVEPSRHAG